VVHGDGVVDGGSVFNVAVVVKDARASARPVSFGRPVPCDASRTMARVLITEELAPSALAVLAAAELEADVRLELDRPALLAALGGAQALVVRSATQVDAEALAAGADLVVVGRAGIGLDNIDVAEATRRGVMVVNAPQSNVVSAAEHTLALMLAQARNVAHAHHDLVQGAWNRSRWEGVELRGKTLAIVGLGRVGVLVAQRALAFGMRLIAYDPFIAADRARQLGVELVDRVEDLVTRADFLTIHLPKTPDTVGLVGREVLAVAKPGIRIVNTARGGILDEAALAEALADGRVAGAALDVFTVEPTTESPLFGLPNVVVTPHLGASTVEAQDHAGQTIAEQVVLALRGEFVPFAVNVDAREASETVRPFLSLAERLAQIFTAMTGSRSVDLEVAYEGQLGDYDCRVLTLAVLKGLLEAVVDEPVSFVNAPQMARERGLVLREAKSSSARDFVNLISLRGQVGGQGHHIAGTLSGPRQEPRIVAIDDHSCDVPPARYMLVVRNRDRPGQIGVVGTVLGRAGVNISDMNLGRSAAGEAALMVLATDTPVPASVVAELQADPGILSARSITLAG
jgi:D-3-phosphoglycerate dehydrogenase